MDFFQLLFGFSGRINRAKYWLAAVIYLVVMLIAVGIKRLHDRDKSGWWLLVFYLLPGVLSGLADKVGLQVILSLASFALSIWGFVEIGCLRGNAGPNKYGSNPLSVHAARG